MTTRTPKPEKALAAILALSVAELRQVAVLLDKHEPEAAQLLGDMLRDKRHEAYVEINKRLSARMLGAPEEPQAAQEGA